MHTIKAEVSKPENDSDFEAMCANIYGAVFGDPSPNRNGRRGQKQAGVDVFVESNEGRVGIQSKRYQDGRLTIKHVEEEVRKADEGKAPIVRLIVATTAASDAALLRQVQELSDRRLLAGLFPVKIDFWSEICTYVDQYPVLQDHYSPNAPGAAFHRVEAGQAAMHTDMRQLLEMVTQLQSGQAQAALPAGRDDSVDRFVTNQLDAVNTMLRASRYQEAEDQLAVIAKNFDSLDAHQKARWHIQRGVCRIHLHNRAGAADDFLTAAELYPADEKMAAAKIRALSMQGKNDEALAAGATALANFPASTQVWTAMGYVRLSAGQNVTEADVPMGRVDDPDVLQLLCWSAWHRNDYANAVAYGRRLLAAPAVGYYGRAAALTAALSLANLDPVARTYGLIDQVARDALAEAVSAFEPRAEKLWCSQSKTRLPDDTIHLAYAYLMLGKPNMTLQVLDESAARIPATPKMLSVRFEALRELGRISDCMALAKAYTAEIEPAALLVVAETASAAGEVGLIEALAQHAPDVAKADDDATLETLRWVALYRSGAEEEALNLVSEAIAVAEPSVQVLMAAVRILLAADRKADAAAQLDRLAAMIPKDAPVTWRMILADLMFFAGRYSEAAQTYAPFALPGQLSELHKKLLRSYIRSGQRRKGKDLLDGFPPHWSHDDQIRNDAIDLANAAGDWSRLLQLAKLEIERSPRHAAPWQLRLAAEVRVLSAGDFFGALAEVPEELEGSVGQITQMASLEIRYDRAKKGMMRLYRLFRRNLDDPEAAAGYMMTVMLGPKNLPWIAQTLTAVAPGCSCCLEDGHGKQFQVTIDPKDAGELPRTAEFIRSVDEKARVLLDKTVGDEVIWPSNFGIERRFKIVSITSAFARLLHITHERAHSPAAELPHIVSMQVIKENGELDLSELQAVLKRNSDGSQLVFETYEKNEITLGVLAAARSTTPLELVVSWPQAGPQMKVCSGNSQELEAALAVLKSAEALVVDLATLGELVLMECETSLGSVDKVYISTSSQHTLKILLGDRIHDRSSAGAIEVDGQIQFHAYSQQHKNQGVEFLERVQRAIDTYCEVCPAYGAQDIPPAFAQLEKLIGDEEYEGMLLAHERKTLFLSIDLHARAIAKVMLDVEGVWPQALLLHAASRQVIDENAYARAVTKIFLGNRTHVSVNAHLMFWMCRQDERTLQDALARLRDESSSPDSDFKSSRDVVREFISLVIPTGVEIGVVFELIDYLYEGLLRHPRCSEEFVDLLQVDIENSVDSMQFSNDVYHSLKVDQTRLRKHLRKMAMDRLAAARDRAQLPLDERPIMLSVMMVTSTPTIVLRPEAVEKHRQLAR